MSKQTEQTELTAIINVALPRFKGKNKQENILLALQDQSIPCAILDGEITGVDGELCWSQQPGSSTRHYFFNYD